MRIFSTLSSLLILSLGLVHPLNAQNTTLYFATPDGGLSDACTQSEPCNISKALGDAVGDGGVIFLGEGNYTSTAPSVLTINKNIDLIGGWDGTLTSPVVYGSKDSVSVIDGQSTRQGIIIAPQKSVTLESLTIANTHADDNGSAIYDFNATALSLNDVTVYHNVAVSSVAHGHIYGGGLFISEGILDINSSTFKLNLASAAGSGYGAALAAYNTEITIADSTFYNNSSWYGSAIYSDSQNKYFTLTDSDIIFNGHYLYLDNTSSYAGYGALYVENGQSRIENSLFKDNFSYNEGTLYFLSGSLLFKNNVISSNESGNKSGFFANKLSSIWLINNIFNDNSSTGPDSSIVKFDSLSGKKEDHVFVNNTLANNSSSKLLYLHATSLAAANNIFANGDVGIYVDALSELDIYNSLWSSISTHTSVDGTITTTDDVVGEAHFVNEGAKDYHIGAASKAINNGMCVDASSHDIDGDFRDENGLCDIGADEYVSSKVSPSILMYLLY